MARNYSITSYRWLFHLKIPNATSKSQSKPYAKLCYFGQFPLITRCVHPCSREAVGRSRYVGCSNEVPPSAMTRPQGWTRGCMLHADPLGSQTLVLDSWEREGQKGLASRASLARSAAAVGTGVHPILPPMRSPAHQPTAHMLAALQPAAAKHNLESPASPGSRARVVEQPHAPVRFPSNLVAYYDCTANLPHCFGP